MRRLPQLPHPRRYRQRQREQEKILTGTQTVQEEAEIPESETEEGLSDMSKILLGLMAVMVVTLVALMTALYFKEEKNDTVPENRRRDNERYYFSRRFRNKIISIDKSDFQADHASV